MTTIRALCFLAGGLTLLAQPYRLAAEHFEIVLRASGLNGITARAFADQSPPEAGVNPRPVLKAHAGDPITVQFTMTNVFPHRTVKDAEIHYYLVKENEIGQKSVPDTSRGVATEGTFNLDLKPKGRIGARFKLVIDEPGAYLLRVESLGTQNTHEHFSAIDLQIQ
jgi:hypothetical protein